MIQANEIQGLIAKGQVQEAIAACDRLLGSIEGSIDSSSENELIQLYYLKSVALRLAKHVDEAITCIKQLLSINSEHARAHQELAYNYRAANNKALALQHFYTASQLNPALLSAWQSALPLYKEANQHEAVKLCELRIKSLSELPKPILGASDLFYENNIDKAEQICLHYLQQHKHSIPALMLLADIAIKLKALGDAEFILETCVELQPKDTEPKYSLYKVYSKLGKYSLALALADQLIEADPANHFFQLSKATCLVSLGDIEQAVSLYNKVLTHRHNDANVYLLLGHALKTKGEHTASVNAYQNAYKYRPEFGDAFWSLANTKTYEFSASEFDLMYSALQQPNTKLEDKVHLHFALGKGLEDKKRFDASFKHYEQGNQLKRSSLSYSAQKHERFVDNMIAAFTPERVSQLSGMGHGSKAPIFILGLPRAGSTLIEQILASHSQVDGTLELHEILGLAAKLSKSKDANSTYPFNLNNIPAKTLEALGKRFIDNTMVYRQGAKYFIDKMPNNFLHIGLIKTILPNSIIIDARREPMACCFGGYKQLFGEGQEFSYSQSDMAHYYSQYLRLMTHWNSIYPNQIVTVHHEQLVQNTEAQIRQLLNACGLKFEQNCINFYTNKRAVNTPSAEQVRQPIYTSGMAQWRNYEDYLQEITTQLKY